jgi:hypothetical protein
MEEDAARIAFKRGVQENPQPPLGCPERQRIDGPIGPSIAERFQCPHNLRQIPPAM